MLIGDKIRVMWPHCCAFAIVGVFRFRNPEWSRVMVLEFRGRAIPILLQENRVSGETGFPWTVKADSGGRTYVS